MRDAHVRDITDVRNAALEMRRGGLTDSDIGTALRIHPLAVRRLLAAHDGDAAALHACAWRRTPHFHSENSQQ